MQRYMNEFTGWRVLDRYDMHLGVYVIDMCLSGDATRYTMWYTYIVGGEVMVGFIRHYKGVKMYDKCPKRAWDITYRHYQDDGDTLRDP